MCVMTLLAGRLTMEVVGACSPAVVTIDVLVIWALTAHGSEMRHA
jgi:hypothetical protein